MLINRLRIGHYHLTHLLLGNEQRTCEPCGAKHMLVKCPNLQRARKKYYSVSSLRHLLVSVDNHNIIDFIKETHFTTVCNVCYFTLYISSIALILCLPFYLCLLFSHHVSLMALNGLLGLCTDVPLRNEIFTHSYNRVLIGTWY